jgi:hypothetical protein
MRSLALGLLLVFGAPVGADLAAEPPGEPPAAPTVTYREILWLQDLVPQTTSWYSVDDEVRVEPPYYVFTVRCAHATYEDVVSVAALVKLAHEIYEIETLRKTDEGRAVWDGAVDAVQGVGKGLKGVVYDPQGSIEAIERGVGRVARAIGRAATGPFSTKAESSGGERRDRRAGGLLANEQARRFCHEHELDVYSENPYVRALVGEVASLRFAGFVGVAAATSVVPGLGAMTRGALTPSATEEDTEHLIRDNGPAELRRALSIQYFETFASGAERSTKETKRFRRFLDNANYSPREQAYIMTRMMQMKELSGRDGLLEILAEVRTVEEAKIVAAQMDLLWAWHRTDRKLIAYHGLKGIVAALDRDGRLLAPFPFDRAGDTPTMRSLVDRLEDRGRRAGTRTVELWLTGTADAGLADLLQSRGVALRECIVRNDPSRSPVGSGAKAGDS